MLRKYVCSCGNAWFAEEKEECSLKEYESGIHKVKTKKNLDSKDYAELWGNDLENANRHSLTDMPETVLKTLKNNIKDEKVILSIMKSFYKNEVGV